MRKFLKHKVCYMCEAIAAPEEETGEYNNVCSDCGENSLFEVGFYVDVFKMSQDDDLSQDFGSFE